jgi:hypothetical protein
MRQTYFFPAFLLCFAIIINAQDVRERAYYYEILQPRHEQKPQVDSRAKKRVEESVTRTTDFTDTNLATGNAVYFVKPVIKRKEQNASEFITVDFKTINPSHYLVVPLKDKSTKAGKLAVGNLNGDGIYDYNVRTPSTNVDPGSRAGDTLGRTYQIEAYLHDGIFLCPLDLGQGIEPGVWYSPFVVYDFNGDGKAEVALKTTPESTKRDSNGHVGHGEEYLIILNGMTGETIAQVAWPERSDRLGNLKRQNRNQIGVAYLDGKTPHILACRGIYRMMMVDAWQLKENKLEPVWRWDGDEENLVVRSMGSHNMICGDVDNDGRDEPLLRSCMLDDNGSLLWSAGLGHPDKIYLTDIDLQRPGLEAFLPLEPWHDNDRSVCVVDAATGKAVWNIGHKTFHVGDGIVTDFDLKNPGMECFASEDRKGGSTDKYLLTANGRFTASEETPKSLSGDFIESTSYNDGKRGAKRSLQYRPDGEDFVCVNGQNRYTRALYGSHSAFRVETSDRPVFATFEKNNSKNIRFLYICENDTLPLEKTESCESRYTPGKRTYKIKDRLFKNGDLSLSVLASPDEEAAIWKIEISGIRDISIRAVLSPIKNQKLNRNGDMGVDPADSFDPSDTLPPLRSLDIPLNEPVKYLLFADNDLHLLPAGKGEAYYQKAESVRKELAERITISTPDPYFNTLGGTLSIAADGIWDGQVWQHGAVGWRMPLSGWRAAYAGDIMGWHDRARTHFNAYAASQVTEVPPVYPHPTQDPSLNLARAEKRWGTQMYSNGYICRNPYRSDQMHHYDMNLCYIDELMWHFLWTGDTSYIITMWPVIERHLEWEKRNYDPDDDGLYDACCCIWASDALYYTGGGVAHSSAYNYRANKLAARLAGMIGKDGEPYKKEAERILSAMNSRLWLSDKGHWAEYQEQMGHKRTYEHAGVWTIYHTIDSEVDNMLQAYQSTRYIDTEIPHIAVVSDDLEEKNLETLSTTNWLPYSWSINNVAFAEVMHTALAYWKAGRNEEAFRLLKSSVIDGMYLGSSPGNFGQISFYDAARGECYRDFGDPVGIASRALIQGLYGIYPDLLDGTVRLVPGFPAEWEHASLKTPYINYSFLRQNKTDQYDVSLHFQRPASLQLELCARYDDAAVTVNGENTVPLWKEYVQYPKMVLTLPQSDNYTIEIQWKGNPLDFSYEAPEKGMRNEIWQLKAANISSIDDPQNVLSEIRKGFFEKPALPGGKNKQATRRQAISGTSPQMQTISGKLSGTSGCRTLFIRRTQGKAVWLQPVQIEIEPPSPSVYIPFGRLDKSACEPVYIGDYFNDSITNIFQNRYFSPRPPFTTLQIPTQGIGEWCHPQLTADIDDSGLRNYADNGIFTASNGIPLQTPGEGRNIVFTSLWDNFPDSVRIPLSGNASNAYLLLAGTTNHMQCHIVNGVIIVGYKDGSADTLHLINPENWCPIEQDFFVDGQAFRLKTSRPYRLHLKSGLLSNHLEKDLNIKGVYGRSIDGGAGILLDMPLNKEKQLEYLHLETISNDIVIGLMAITLQRYRPLIAGDILDSTCFKNELQ